jgi:pimeloyl-ACP methyl ester carboxylesterase
MTRLPAIALTGAAAMLLAACGGGGGGGGSLISTPTTPTSTARGTVLSSPPTEVARLSASDLATLLDVNATSKQLKALAGTPKCGIDLRSINYHTIGGQGEATNATAAIMVPAGTDPSCNGPLPIVLYAHGTNLDRTYNIADWIDPNNAAAAEGAVVAAMYAAQGFIVVAPNYAGYDLSTLSYHPYLNGDQQGKDMVDALTAARSQLGLISATDSGKLFVTGYSQGGYVALAAQRELQANAKTVTASGPLSAPSAISALIDYTFSGWPAAGSTQFVPLLTTSWQKQFGNIYNATTDIYESQYATGIDTLLPTTTPNTLFPTKLPPLALFPANASPGPINAQLSIFYGANNLVKQSYLSTAFGDVQGNPCPGNALPATNVSLNTAAPLACAPQVGFRKAAVANDLRSFLPTRPVFFCGGDLDPTVNFVSTRATAGYFVAKGLPSSSLTVVDLEQSTASDAYSSARTAFAIAKAAVAQAAGTDPTAQATAVLGAYHATLVFPYCMVSARSYFQGLLNSGA